MPTTLHFVQMCMRSDWASTDPVLLIPAKLKFMVQQWQHSVVTNELVQKVDQIMHDKHCFMISGLSDEFFQMSRTNLFEFGWFWTCQHIFQFSKWICSVKYFLPLSEPLSVTWRILETLAVQSESLPWVL